MVIKWKQLIRRYRIANRQPLKKLTLFCCFFLIAFSLDWWTKVWIDNHPTARYHLIGNFLQTHYELNPDAAFGIKLPPIWIFLLSSLVVIIIWVWFWMIRLQLMSWFLILLQTGAIGNLLTRFWVGNNSEIDFLMFTWSAQIGSRTCNIADLYVFLALPSLLVIQLLLIFHPATEKMPINSRLAHHHWSVGAEWNQTRLDHFLVAMIQASKLNISRGLVVRWIHLGAIRVNQQSILKPSHLVRTHDQVECQVPARHSIRSSPRGSAPKLIYQDEVIVVVNKPNHMVVYPTPHHPDHTLVDYLRTSVYPLAPDPLRPGIIHRLDQDTTGLILIAKTDAVRTQLTDQLHRRQITRTYLAIVHGVIKVRTGKIQAPIGKTLVPRPMMKVDLVTGKPAITKFLVCGRTADYTLVRCQLVTGRTHQIRLHFQHIGHPVVGDHTYGLTADQQIEFGQYLHAWKLNFYHPTKHQQLDLTAPWPNEFKKKLKQLKLDQLLENE